MALRAALWVMHILLRSTKRSTTNAATKSRAAIKSLPLRPLTSLTLSLWLYLHLSLLLATTTSCSYAADILRCIGFVWSLWGSRAS